MKVIFFFCFPFSVHLSAQTIYVHKQNDPKLLKYIDSVRLYEETIKDLTINIPLLIKCKTNIQFAIASQHMNMGKFKRNEAIIKNGSLLMALDKAFTEDTLINNRIHSVYYSYSVWVDINHYPKMKVMYLPKIHPTLTICMSKPSTDKHLKIEWIRNGKMDSSKVFMLKK